MPSVTLEGFGLSTIEALSCGVPVLGTPTGATPEILNEILPDFILPGVDPDVIAKGILGRIDGLGDDVMKERLRKFSARFSWDRVADKVEKLFVDMVGGN